MSLPHRLPLFLLFLLSALVSAGTCLSYCKNFDLVPSPTIPGQIFLKTDCLGVYGNTTQTQCSYLDLNQ